MVKKKIVKMLSRRHGSVPNLQVSTALDRVREQSSSQFTVQFFFFGGGAQICQLPLAPWASCLQLPTVPQMSSLSGEQADPRCLLYFLSNPFR